jgi:hypothetical protein
MGYLDLALEARVRMENQDNHHALIDRTLQEINKEWESGALEWIRVSRPDKWGEMVTLEGRVNELALEGNLKGLREALDEYQRLILSLPREFKSPKEKKGQGMFSFGESLRGG